MKDTDNKINIEWLENLVEKVGHKHLDNWLESREQHARDDIVEFFLSVAHHIRCNWASEEFYKPLCLVKNDLLPFIYGTSEFESIPPLYPDAVDIGGREEIGRALSPIAYIRIFLINFSSKELDNWLESREQNVRDNIVEFFLSVAHHIRCNWASEEFYKPLCLVKNEIPQRLR